MDVAKFLRVPQYFRNIQRVYEIIRVLLKYGFGDLLQRLHISPYLDVSVEVLGRSVFSPKLTQLTFSERLRMACEELGPTFIKFAQTISTRPDLFPTSITEELRKLQDKVQPFPTSVARAIIEAQLGRPIMDICSEFTEVPLGSASISQVHAVRLKDGRKAVMKVQRPDLDKIISTDTEILLGLATLVEEHIPESRSYRPVRIVTEFCRVLWREMDFEREAAAMDRFAKEFADEPRLIVPKVYHAFSSKRVLTQEFIDGVPADSKILTSLTPLVRKQIVETLGRVLLRSIFEVGYYHGDPHPGNVFVTPDDRIALLDFGAMGRMDEQRQLQVLQFLMGILDSDLDTVIRVLQHNQIAPHHLDEIQLKIEIADTLEPYLGASIGRINMANLLTDIFEVIRQFGLTPPPDLLLVAKSITLFQHLGSTLDPTFEPVRSMKPYLSRRYIKLLTSPNRIAKKSYSVAESYHRFVGNLPIDLGQLFSGLSREQLTFFHQYRDTEPLLRHHNRVVNRLIMSLVGATLLIIGAILKVSRHAGEIGTISIGLLVWGSLVLIFVWIAVKRSGGM